MENTTPIQCLIDCLIREGNLGFSNKEELDRVIFALKTQLIQKEKQFAKECFEAGQKYGMDISDSIEWGTRPSVQDFEQFYSKYVEQKER